MLASTGKHADEDIDDQDGRGEGAGRTIHGAVMIGHGVSFRRGCEKTLEQGGMMMGCGYSDVQGPETRF